MLTLPAGLDLNTLILLPAIGLGVGVLSGFTGIGGGFIVTPALIVLGFPANIAVGTSLLWVSLNSLAGVISHRNVGHIDTKLGIAITLPSLAGVEIGVRLANDLREAGLADVATLALTTFLMIIVGAYTLVESITRKNYLDMLGRDRGEVGFQPTPLALRLQKIKLSPIMTFKKAGISISVWIILALGFIAGIIIGLTGSGGGFIVVPALVYIAGVAPFIAVGTDLLQVFLSSSYGAVRHFISGNTLVMAAFLILVTSIFGVILGTRATRYVRGVAMRLVLGLTISVVCVGSVFKLIWIAFDRDIAWLELSANLITFAGIGLAMLMVLALSLISRRHAEGKNIPQSLESLCQSSLCRTGDEQG